MFSVERQARGHRYVYLVESVRGGAKVRQRTIKALGRKDALIASGQLDRLAASLLRHSERSVILSDIDAGRITAQRIGGPLLFGRLWDRLGRSSRTCVRLIPRPSLVPGFSSIRAKACWTRLET
jgi:hypothetical protein